MPAPFSDQRFTFSNPDGSTVEVRGWGNQYYAVFETLDGYTVVEDPETGYFTYARLSGGTGRLESTGVRAGQADPESLGLPQHLRPRQAAAKEQAAEVRGAENVQSRWEVRRAQKKGGPAPSLPNAAADFGPSPAAAVTGRKVGLCILVEFPDVPATIARHDVDRFCNEQGYTGFGNNGSVRDYFHEVSGGKVTYTNVVTAYYKAAHKRSYYTNESIPQPVRARKLVREALDELVAGGFNFSRLSVDSDGYVYALNIFYAGDVVNNWAKGLWPHHWHLRRPYKVGERRKFFDYQITNLGSELSLGTFCHENGHMLCDFPDLYDYGDESWGAGAFSLMAYGDVDKKNPVHVDAYLKAEAGWASRLTSITPGTTATVHSGQNDFHVFTKSATEYFIIENRQQSGRDAELPDSGLAIWHVDENGSNSNEQMTRQSHYECSLEQADGQFDLERNKNPGDAGDLFGDPGRTRFADDTTPDSRWWNGRVSGLNITSVSAPGITMTFKT